MEFLFNRITNVQECDANEVEDWYTARYIKK